MSNDLLIAHALEKIGSLEQRISSIESSIYSDENVYNTLTSMNTLVEEESQPTPISHRFGYPLKGEGRDEVSQQEFREIRYSTYKVKIAQPYSDPPLIVDTDMTRDELDDYVNCNPGKKFGEWIISIKPTYEDNL